MGQTKAAKIIQALRDNDLASSCFEAVLKNDDEILTDALAEANISTDDFKLSDDEFTNFVKGVQPSGELDLVTWEGYYEATSYPASVGAKAFLILAGTEKVYFGSPEEIQDKPLKHAVAHSLTKDGKIEFTLSGGDKVSIALTRVWDSDEHTDTTTFTGTIKGEALSGQRTMPPLTKKAGTTSATAKASPVSRSFLSADIPLSLKADENGGGQKPPDDFSARQIITFWIPVFWAYLSGIFTLYEIWNRYRASQDEKDKGSKKANKLMQDNKNLVEDVADRNCVVDAVNYSGAAPIITENTASDINENLENDRPDYTTETPDVVVAGRRDMAKAAGDRNIQDYARAGLAASVERQLRGFRCLDYFNDMKARILNKRVTAQAQEKMNALSPASVYDPLLRHTVLEDRAEVSADSYLAAMEASNGTQQAYEAAAAETSRIQNDLQDINDKLEAEKNDGQTSQEQIAQDEERKKQLEKELDDAKATEADKAAERDKAKKDEADAKKKKDDTQKEADEDKSKEDWDRKAGEVFK